MPKFASIVDSDGSWSSEEDGQGDESQANNSSWSQQTESESDDTDADADSSDTDIAAYENSRRGQDSTCHIDDSIEIDGVGAHSRKKFPHFRRLLSNQAHLSQGTSDSEGVSEMMSESDSEDGGAEFIKSAPRFQTLLLAKECPTDRQLLYPPSLLDGQNDDLESKNRHTIHEVLLMTPLQDGWRELELHNFCVYNCLDHKTFPGQFESLHTVASEQKKRQHLIDGTVTYRGHQIVVGRALVHAVSIGGLDRDCHSCGNEFWVQTEESFGYRGWFKLVNPMKTYDSVWHDFRWVANLAKYCMDYFLISQQHGSGGLHLNDFRSNFMDCIKIEHGHDTQFQQWEQMLGPVNDMRRHITKFGNFIYDQCYSSSLDSGFESHPLWNEIGCGLVFRSVEVEERTLVTRNTARTFLPSFPSWGPPQHDLLTQRDCHEAVEVLRAERMQILHIPNKLGSNQQNDFHHEDGRLISKVERTLQKARSRNQTIVGDPIQLLHKMVVVRQPCRDGTEIFDFAFVTQLTNDKKSVRIVWLTLPSDTICASPRPGKGRFVDERNRLKAHYPIGNELFFSNDCNCHSVQINNVVAVHDITVLEEFRGQACEFFATILYCGKDNCFVNPDRSRWPMMCRKLCSSLAKGGTHASYNTTCGRQPNRKSYHSGTPLGEPPQSTMSSENAFPNLSLFTGCGLLDRALESSSPLYTALSIDCNAVAIRSAKANAPGSGGKTQEFVHNSVNHELRKVMIGKRTYPKPTCLSAGCPCPGFSLLNNHRNSTRSQRNCTMLASTMSWVEVTLPGFVVIENVLQMDSGSPSACSQAISFLVALGYQVRKIALNASDFGGCTTRERLFILASAPAYRLPSAPVPSRGIGTASKLKITIRDAIGSLPNIHNDTLLHVVYPYHIPLARLRANITNRGPNFRDILHRIPQYPPEQGLIASMGNLTKVQRSWVKSLSYRKQCSSSRTMKRIKASGFFRTIVTIAQWKCAISGQLVHYNQDRIISLEEAARAQGIPGDFVLIGSTLQQLKQIGNAVPWCFREAIGREIAKVLGCESRPERIDVGLDSKYRESSSALCMRPTLGIPIVQDNNEEDEIQLGTKDDFDRARLRRLGQSKVENLSMTLQVYTPTTRRTQQSQFNDTSRLQNTLKCVSQGKFSLYMSSRSSIELREDHRSSVRVEKRPRSTSDSHSGSESVGNSAINYDDNDGTKRVAKRQAIRDVTFEGDDNKKSKYIPDWILWQKTSERTMDRGGKVEE